MQVIDYSFSSTQYGTICFVLCLTEIKTIKAYMAACRPDWSEQECIEHAKNWGNKMSKRMAAATFDMVEALALPYEE